MNGFSRKDTTEDNTYIIHNYQFVVCAYEFNYSNRIVVFVPFL